MNSLCGLTSRSTRTLLGGAYAPSARRRLALFVSRPDQSMSDLHGWGLPLGLLGLGAVLLGFAWVVLAEYRKLFLAEPLSVMSLEILAKILGAGGPGYFAVMFLLAGGVMFGVGVLATLLQAGTYIFMFIHRAFPAT